MKEIQNILDNYDNETIDDFIHIGFSSMCAPCTSEMKWNLLMKYFLKIGKNEIKGEDQTPDDAVANNSWNSFYIALWLTKLSREGLVKVRKGGKILIDEEGNLAFELANNGSKRVKNRSESRTITLDFEAPF